MGKLFGTNGIRGVANEFMTPDFSLKIGMAIGSEFKNGSILIGTDSRLSGPMIKMAVISGLLSTGVNIMDCGLAPTPAIQFATKHWNIRGSVIITASHNPPEFNGIKVVDSDGIEILPDIEDKIENRYFSNNYSKVDWSKTGKYEFRNDVLEFYKKGLLKKINSSMIKKRKIKVIVDPANGVGGLVTPYILRDAGCEVATINSHIDGLFPGRNPEPNNETLDLLRKTVVSSGADLGIAHDGDADRVVFIDENGVFQWGDIIFSLLIKKLLQKNKKGKIVTPVASSKLVHNITQEYGGELIITKVGSVIVARKLQEVKGLLGGEENGGIFYPSHQYVRDGAMGALLLVEYLSETNQTLSELIKELPKYYQVKKKINCPDEQKNKVLKKVKEKMLDYKIEEIDGLKIWIKNGWLLIRPSGTEPILRWYAESNTQDETEMISTWGKKLIEEAINEK